MRSISICKHICLLLFLVFGIFADGYSQRIDTLVKKLDVLVGATVGFLAGKEIVNNYHRFMNLRQPKNGTINRSSRQLITIVFVFLFLVMIAMFWVIADEIVMEHENAFDTFFFNKLQQISSPGTQRIMLFFTFFGSTLFLLPCYIILVVFYLFRRKFWMAILVVAIGLSSTLGLFFLKNLFHRPRPLHELIMNVQGFSFPSGHSFSAFTFFGLITYIIWGMHIKILWQSLSSILLFMLCCMVGLSRIYLHVHYASDVVAGFCLSVIWLTIFLWIFRKIQSNWT